MGSKKGFLDNVQIYGYCWDETYRINAYPYSMLFKIEMLHVLIVRIFISNFESNDRFIYKYEDIQSPFLYLYVTI